MTEFKMASRKIGGDAPTFIIAEISANHAQNRDKAISLIKEAKMAGADAVKFQLFTPKTITIDVDNEYFLIKHPKWGGQTLYSLYEKAYLPWKWVKELKKVAEDLGIIFFATAFDRTAVDFLEELGVPAHKISSFELVDLPLIEYMAKTKKPLILSTGMATKDEIEEAVDTAKKAGAKDILLLKCVSNYPVDPEGGMNLRTISDLKERFNCPVGLSDHTLGTDVPVIALSLGAQVIEKHITLSRKLKTLDDFFSTEPHELKKLIKTIRAAEKEPRELKELVKRIKITEKVLGEICYGPTKQEERNKVFRRSLFVVKDIKLGEFFTEENIRSIRPGQGLLPKYLKEVLGKKAKSNIQRGTPLKENLID